MPLDTQLSCCRLGIAPLNGMLVPSRALLRQGPCPSAADSVCSAQVWFQELHAALPPRHRELLRGIYLVRHLRLSACLKNWASLEQPTERRMFNWGAL